MALIEIRIHQQSYEIKSDETPEHLSEVAAMVQSKVDALLAQHPRLAPAQVALLAAAEFSSKWIRAREQVESHRNTLLSKAGDILDRIEKELSPVVN
jgi:cell division protein ZapA (FtsZ GTPase activity inhibitor)